MDDILDTVVANNFDVLVKEVCPSNVVLAAREIVESQDNKVVIAKDVMGDMCDILEEHMFDAQCDAPMRSRAFTQALPQLRSGTSSVVVVKYAHTVIKGQPRAVIPICVDVAGGVSVPDTFVDCVHQVHALRKRTNDEFKSLKGRTRKQKKRRVKVVRQTKNSDSDSDYSPDDGKTTTVLKLKKDVMDIKGVIINETLDHEDDEYYYVTQTRKVPIEGRYFDEPTAEMEEIAGKCWELIRSWMVTEYGDNKKRVDELAMMNRSTQGSGAITAMLSDDKDRLAASKRDFIKFMACAPDTVVIANALSDSVSGSRAISMSRKAVDDFMKCDEVSGTTRLASKVEGLVRERARASLEDKVKDVARKRVRTESPT